LLPVADTVPVVSTLIVPVVATPLLAIDVSPIAND
jgi:hypothetical protein